MDARLLSTSEGPGCLGAIVLGLLGIGAIEFLFYGARWAWAALT